MENRWETSGKSAPRSVNSELHTQPASSCVQGCVAQLCEACGCVDDRWVVSIPRAMCRLVNCLSKEGAPRW